jgi:hypothetical protein
MNEPPDTRREGASGQPGPASPWRQPWSPSPLWGPDQPGSAPGSAPGSSAGPSSSPAPVPSQPSPPPPPPGWGQPSSPPPPPGWGQPSSPPGWHAGGPAPSSPPGWGYQQASWGSPPWAAAVPQAHHSSAPLILGIVLLVVAVCAGGGLFMLTASDPSVHQSPSPAGGSAAPQGSVVFHDDFKDPSSGWYVGDTTSATFAYTSDGYRISADPTDLLDYYAVAPYGKPLPELSVTVTESISAGADPGEGIGVMCRQGQGSTRVQYEFLLKVSGRWLVQLRTGTPSVTNEPDLLRSGTSSTVAGPGPVTVTGRCLTRTDGRTTRLVFEIAGTTVIDFTDGSGGSLPDEGWFGGLEGAIGPTPAAVTATYFEEQDSSQ